ncbi:DNA alkylation repair protein [Catenovulum sediminis]|uniref:DNA alkylation repair protein n=1 Tax=Catenovulum sediminis TaxID=1740262 RepID=A0ABV1RDE6_9ALTE|nr:DNA alkylation repair protein [Catenovulum sediminis]
MEPFKNVFNIKLIEQLARQIKRQDENFNEAGFVSIAAHNLERLELKQRSQQIYQALLQTLPDDYPTACQILLNTLAPVDETSEEIHFTTADNGMRGWAIMPMADFVALKGLDNIEYALSVLREMTKRFSAEFAIRYLIEKNPTKVLDVLDVWLQNDTSQINTHVRRLISEGTRPRLPWGIRLSCFITQPELTLTLLEKLKDDPSEYVRRSVANHLNDISKDHPDLVIKVMQSWMKDANADRQKLIKHAARSLIKNGYQPALRVFGYAQPIELSCQLKLATENVQVGQSLAIEIIVSSAFSERQNLIIDYLVYHQKANGQLSAKVFKWKTLTIKKNETITLNRKHSFKPVTTRKYYAGQHQIEIQINGSGMAKKSFNLLNLS